MRRVLAFSALVVLLISSVLLTRLSLRHYVPPPEIIHIALGANMNVLPGIVTTMWSVQQNTKAPGKLQARTIPPC